MILQTPEMEDSELKTNSKHKWIVCFYDRDKTNFDEVINRALNKFKLKPGQVPVICLPRKRGNHARLSKKTT